MSQGQELVQQHEPERPQDFMQQQQYKTERPQELVQQHEPEKSEKLEKCRDLG